MTTVLLWGNQWWVPGRADPVPFADRSQAAPSLARSWVRADRALRIVFEPDDFVSTAANCPNTRKASLGAALAEEFPSLGDPAVAWSHEPILPSGPNFNTLLHCEGTPWLHVLVKELEERELVVESAIPMPAWLNALPAEVTRSGAITVFALQGERFCLYRHSPGGVRTALKRCGADARDTLVTHLRSMVKGNPGEFVFGVVADGGVLEAISGQLELEAGQWAGAMTLDEALGEAAVVPARHPAQLLPPRPVVSPARLVTAAAVLLGVLVAIGTVHYGRLELQARTTASLRAALREDLQKSVAQLRANQAEAATLRAEIAALAMPAPRAADFIRKTGALVPPDIVLSDFRIAGAAYALQGWARPGAGERWAKGIAGARFTEAAGGSFRVEGAMP